MTGILNRLRIPVILAFRILIVEKSEPLPRINNLVESGIETRAGGGRFFLSHRGGIVSSGIRSLSINGDYRGLREIIPGTLQAAPCVVFFGQVSFALGAASEMEYQFLQFGVGSDQFVFLPLLFRPTSERQS